MRSSRRRIFERLCRFLLKVERVYSKHIFIDILRLFRNYLQWRTKINVMKGKCFVIPSYTWSWYLPHSAVVVVYLNLVIQIENLTFAKWKWIAWKCIFISSNYNLKETRNIIYWYLSSALFQSDIVPDKFKHKSRTNRCVDMISLKLQNSFWCTVRIILDIVVTLKWLTKISNI